MSNKKWSLTKAIFGKSSLPNYTGTLLSFDLICAFSNRQIEKSESDDSSTEDEEKLETDDDEEDFITLDKSKFRPKSILFTFLNCLIEIKPKRKKRDRCRKKGNKKL